MSKTKKFRIFENEYESLLKYPFKSKFKYLYDQNIPKEPYIPDYKLKATKQYGKPNFSNEPGCWEMDLMFANYFDARTMTKIEQIYLVMINVNTRFLIVKPLKNKTEEEIRPILIPLIQQYGIRVIKCDGEAAFVAMKDEIVVIHTNKDYISPKKLIPQIGKRITDCVIPNLSTLIAQMIHKNQREEAKYLIVHDHNTKFFKNILAQKYKDLDAIDDWYVVKFVINSSPYTLSHKIVDAVIRTIRNAFGLDNRRLADLRLMRQFVYLYNSSPHRSLKFKNYWRWDESQPKNLYYAPYQVQNNNDLEWRYIRNKRNELRDKQQSLLQYRRGNIILVHLNLGKTKMKFEKQRRNFNDIAEFICYRNGNVICRLLKGYKTYTKIDKKKYQPYIPGSRAKTDDENAIIEVPIAYTKYVCNNYSELGETYKKYFDV